MQKDLNIALDLGREMNIPLLNTSLAHEVLASAKAMGYCDKDFAVLFKVLARMSGINEG
jgi:3-hydroxyisobutyrate dehydrogenase-like beta-hydroxyacid dehydrogenase